MEKAIIAGILPSWIFVCQEEKDSCSCWRTCETV